MSHANDPSRRDLLKYTAAAAGIPLVGTSASARTVRASETGRAFSCSTAKPKNVIFLVADGMSVGVPSLAEPFSQLVRGRSTYWHRLASSPDETTFGHFDMASLDSLVTDSAAAASAWGSGSRINNGAINMLPDNARLTPIGPLAKDAGRSTGLVTTTRVTHATPAGFGAVVPRRSMEDAIAEQYVDRIDVVLGGGRRHFEHGDRHDGRDLFSEYGESGYTLLRTRDELKRINAEERLLGLFYDSHLPYSIDRRRESALQESVPTLAEMTRVALRSLSSSNDGFLLQVEGGRVDHAAHGNDAAAIMWDQLAFDDAIGVCLEFLDEHPDTLIVMTTDHGNANPGLNGMGAGYRRSTESFERLTKARASYSAMSSRMRRRSDETNNGDLSAEVVREAVKWGTDIELTEDEAQIIVAARTGGDVQELNDQLSSWRGQLGQMLGNHTGVQWTGRTHTADWAMVQAVGRHREAFEGLLRNTDAYDIMAEILGVTHRNPKADPAHDPDDDDGRPRRGIGGAWPAEYDPTDSHWT